MKRKHVSSLIIAVAVSWGGATLAQVPVIDNATLTQATQTASNTAQIMNTNQQILDTVNKTLQAVTGSRTTGSLSSIASGGGFSVSSVPDLSSILGGSSLSLGSLGSFGSTASQIINALNLVKTLTGATSASTATDQAYTGAVNTSAVVTASVAGAQAASTSRLSGFSSAASQIGSAGDIKASIDQNSQLQTQTGQTINELIGTVNLTNAALNAQQQQDLAAQSKLSNMWTFDKSKATLVGN